MTDIITLLRGTIGASDARQELGTRRKTWLTTVAGVAGGVLSSVLGGKAAARAAKKAKEEADYRATADDAWYDKRYNTDYIDTQAGANLIRRAQDIVDRNTKKVDGAAAVGGGTAAATAQAKESANRAIADATSQVAAQDTSRKDAAANAHQQSAEQISRDNQAIETQRAASVQQAASQASNAILQGATTLIGSQPAASKSLNISSIAPSSIIGGSIEVAQAAQDLRNKTIPPLSVATGV